MKVSTIIICCIINSFCFSQTKALLICLNKKDTAKKRTASLPFQAVIRTIDKNTENVVIVNANDSVIKALKYMFDYTKPLSDTENALINKEEQEWKLIKHNKKLSSKEKEEKYEQLQMRNYHDTISFKTSNVEKIQFLKQKPSKAAKALSITIYSICGIALIVGMARSINDSINPPKQRPIFAAVAVAGLGGMITCLVWVYHIMHENIYVKEWFLRTTYK